MRINAFDIGILLSISSGPSMMQQQTISDSTVNSLWLQMASVWHINFVLR